MFSCSLRIMAARARSRSTTGGYIFSLFVSPLGGGGWEALVQIPSLASGLMSFLGRGSNPSLWSRVLFWERLVQSYPRTGGSHSPPPWPGPGWWYLSQPGPEQGVPPYPRQYTPQTGYATGSTPLAVTQEDFLVFCK